MSKGLEALKEYRKHQQGVNVYADELLDIVEKELKALEIIKRLPKDYTQTLLGFLKDEWFKDENYGDFISWGGDETPILISEEEFNLLKEVLK